MKWYVGLHLWDTAASEDPSSREHTSKLTLMSLLWSQLLLTELTVVKLHRKALCGCFFFG